MERARSGTSPAPGRTEISGNYTDHQRGRVLPGSGLSSSAALEVLVGIVINHLFFGAKASAPEVAQIGQYAENVFFGKPCGLMNQTASAVGGLVIIDFADKARPLIRPVDFDFSATGHAMCSASVLRAVCPRNKSFEKV